MVRRRDDMVVVLRVYSGAIAGVVRLSLVNMCRQLEKCCAGSEQQDDGDGEKSPARVRRREA